MRLLLVSDHYPPFVGGAERQTWLIATRFAAAGHEVAVAAPWANGLPELEDDEGVTVHRIRQVRDAWRGRDGEAIRHPPPYPDPLTTWKLRRLIRSFRPDVVHSHGWISYSAAAALIGLRIPLVLHNREYGYICANRTLLRGDAPCSGPALSKCFPCAGRYYGRSKGWAAVVGVRLCQPLLRFKISGMISDSTFVARTMRTQLLRETNGSGSTVDLVIPSFLQDDPEGAPLDEYLDLLPKEPFIIYVGQFRRLKGLDVLFEAYERLEDPPPLVLIGQPHPDGPRELPAYATVLTRWPHRAVMAAYERSSFAVMPSLLPEPLGQVVHEAMSRGKPVIGTNHGGHPDMIVDGESGFLVLPGDVDALVEAMERLDGDPELRARMGEAARQRSSLFNASTAFPRIADLYANVAAQDGHAVAARADEPATKSARSGDGERVPFAIVGAGPYGLALAHVLATQGHAPLVVGPPMDTWANHMPRGMFLKSEGRASSIIASEEDLTLGRYCAEVGADYADLGTPVPIETFVSYGRWFQAKAVPGVVPAKVQEIRRGDGAFELALADGASLRAEQVALAIGVQPFAYMPDEIHALPPALRSHTIEHHDLARFAGKRVVVVGCGQSALESAALIHEAGGTATVLARSSEVRWNPPPRPESKSRLGRLRHPYTPLGPGWPLWPYANLAPAFPTLPEGLRRRKAREILGPSGGWWLRERVESRVPLLTSREIVRCAAVGDTVQLVLQGPEGVEELEADHVLAATGFRVDVSRMTMLDPELRASIATSYGAPIVSSALESSVAGLFFTGFVAVNHYGPLMRFVSGAEFAARQVASAAGARANLP